MKPVVVSNVFSDDNKGGSVITQLTIDWVKRHYPGSPVYLVPVEQSEAYEERAHRFTRRHHPDIRILRSPLRGTDSPWATTRACVRSLFLLLRRAGRGEFERTIASADAVVSKGGYVFVERETRGGLLALWFTAFPLVYAARKGVPTVVLCSTVGPYRSASSRFLNRWILRQIDLVVTRDPNSTREARALGCRRVLECPDIALTYDPPRTGDPSGAATPGSPYAAFVVSHERRRAHEGFLERLVALARLLLEERTVERVIVTVQSEEDAPLSERFMERCADPRVTLLSGDLSPEDLMAVYRGARIVISKRLHAGLFALLAGVPVLIFSTDGVKAEGILEQLELRDRLLPYPEFSVEDVNSRIHTILENEHREAARVRDRLDRGIAEARAVLENAAVILRGESTSEDEPPLRAVNA